MSTQRVQYFGIRHHGPGCARSLLRAFEAMRPDCVLIEGPAGSEPLLQFVRDAGMQPPVALLSHCTERPQLAVFHPFAEFSPEWQAMRWAAGEGVPVQFIDVPAGASLGWMQADRAGGGSDAATDTDAVAGKEAAPDRLNDANDAGHDGGRDHGELHGSDDARGDPLDWLARAAGYGDGESWWNHMVEERGDGEGLFDAIAEAMGELRDNAQLRSSLDQGREALREAHMRQGVREAARQGHQRIAVVCGAWHVPALAGKSTASSDKTLLKDLPKLKTQTTWVPWTYRHLSVDSGYGAGIASPGWYDHLWRQGAHQGPRVVGWFARVARILREHELDCSSAHLIEAARLADTLAALRDRPQPGLDELNEATRTVICNGADAPMQLIAERLLVGDVLGSVPVTVPTVPLQRDLEAQQKRLRLKAETLARTIDLDLRNDNDLQRSHLLHRLGLIGIGWGSLSRSGRSSRGTFHEVWELAWDPHYEIDLIIASRHGHTLEMAATACAIEQAGSATTLSDLAALIDRVLLAHLPGAVHAVSGELEARAAIDADPLALLAALPALANVYRYGNVRSTDVALVAHVFDSMLVRGCIALPLAVSGLDDEAASAARQVVLSAERAVALRQDEAQSGDWRRALSIIAVADSATPLLRGACARLLLDAGVLAKQEVEQQLALNLSQGADPLHAAHWLDGFLNRNAAVLLHGDDVWPLLDEWLSGLANDHFVRVLPLLRRTFSEFEQPDRRDLATRVGKVGRASAPVRTQAWNGQRALRALPALRDYLGMNDGH